VVAAEAAMLQTPMVTAVPVVVTVLVQLVAVAVLAEAVAPKPGVGLVALSKTAEAMALRTVAVAHPTKVEPQELEVMPPEAVAMVITVVVVVLVAALLHHSVLVAVVAGLDISAQEHHKSAPKVAVAQEAQQTLVLAATAR